MLIDCDTCTARGTGCAACVVTVLLGAPPGWQSVDPVVVPMPARAGTAARAEKEARSGGRVPYRPRRLRIARHEAVRITIPLRFVTSFP